MPVSLCVTVLYPPSWLSKHKLPVRAQIECYNDSAKTAEDSCSLQLNFRMHFHIDQGVNKDILISLWWTGGIIKFFLKIYLSKGMSVIRCILLSRCCQSQSKFKKGLLALWTNLIFLEIYLITCFAGDESVKRINSSTCKKKMSEGKRNGSWGEKKVFASTFSGLTLGVDYGCNTAYFSHHFWPQICWISSATHLKLWTDDCPWLQPLLFFNQVLDQYLALSSVWILLYHLNLTSSHLHCAIFKFINNICVSNIEALHFAPNGKFA